jgi:hypothetical protein
MCDIDFLFVTGGMRECPEKNNIPYFTSVHYHYEKQQSLSPQRKKFYAGSNLVTGQKFAMIWQASRQLSQYSDYAMRWMKDKYGLHFRQRLG